MKFAFILAEKGNHSVVAMCRVLEVTPQGYYAFLKRPSSPRVAADEALSRQVRKTFDDSGATYGSPRVLKELRRQGVSVGKRRVERAMRGMGLTPPTRRRHRLTTTREPADPVVRNVLNRDFTATRPNERWVTDITYIWTDEGWTYLAAILDLFSRGVVGWALSDSLSTALPLEALDAALCRRVPSAGLLHHSDRGCQYTSATYRRTLAENGIDVSMSRKGNCWDNAVAESFFASLKNELIHRRRWRTRTEVRNAVFEYIETFYNRRRLHSSLNYKTPAEVEREYDQAA